MARYSYTPGCLAEKPNPFMPDEKVTIYNSKEAGIRWPEPFTVVCQIHKESAGADTIVTARRYLDHPDEFCTECQVAARVKQQVQEEARISQIIQRQNRDRKKGWW